MAEAGGGAVKWRHKKRLGAIEVNNGVGACDVKRESVVELDPLALNIIHETRVALIVHDGHGLSLISLMDEEVLHLQADGPLIGSIMAGDSPMFLLRGERAFFPEVEISLFPSDPLRLLTATHSSSITATHTLLSSLSSALYNFVTLRYLSLAPDFHTFPFAFKACSLLPSSSSISIALSLHSQAFKFGFLADPFSLNAFICVYSLHRRIHDAHKLFNESSHRDVVSYNAMVHGFVKIGETTRPQKLFDEMPERDSVSWGTMIADYSNAKLCYEAIDLFNEMIGLRIRLDNIALANVLSACAQTGELEQGRIVHDYITRNGIRIDSYLATGLVDLYAKCDCLENARDAQLKETTNYTITEI
ncbi:pentatricopeptide repeat-containing protein At5g61800-like [Arachis ipaensis]|uniref:pentatricopeptide repeat-containing protein At5g61800-like n=1 Tax=Arachis ipaensis TaxID=130454 RepID=UPI0007AF25E6|nr:pentatricopeptide repeat-containing protein At5g61800-like [Arachis ipaensis]XP_025636336.1 pentatricopeptide repeat-containing protein At5g61800-like [Arachis hypogaea]